MNVLLLNASEEILNILDWKKAVVLFIQGRAKCPYDFYDFYDIKTTSGLFSLPSALVLKKYIRVPFDHVCVNKINVLRRDNYECQFCGVKLKNSTGTVDHIIPTSKGGKHSWKNVVAACRNCNRDKDSLSLKDFEKKFGKRLKREPFAPTRRDLLFSTINITKEERWQRWIEKNVLVVK